MRGREFIKLENQQRKLSKWHIPDKKGGHEACKSAEMQRDRIKIIKMFNKVPKDLCINCKKSYLKYYFSSI